MENFINKIKSIVNIREKRMFLIFFSLLFCSLATLIYFFYPVQEHWQSIFRPAALEILHFRNPYTIEKFFNPPWALIPIIPFAVLPERLGNALWAATSIVMLGYVFKKLGASWPLTLVFLLLPFTLYNMVQVNIDWIVALGFLLSPRWALFLILLKPQIGGLLAIYWGIEAWKQGGIKQVAYVFGPVSIAFLVSFLIFGVYLQKAEFMVSYFGFNQTLWPFSLPIGLALFIYSFKLKKPLLNITASPLLSPYIQPYSLPLVLFGLLPDRQVTLAALIGLWLILVDPRFSYIFDRLIIR